MEMPIPKLWEFHPVLVHFPIALLLGAAALEFFALWRPSGTCHRVAAGLLLSGVICGWLAAAAGGLAYFTVPAHTEEGHQIMFWHLGLGLVMLVLFTCVSVARWRQRSSPASKPQLIGVSVGVALLVLTGHLGASLVYHHGAGVDPRILAPEIREGHSHQSADSPSSDTEESHHHSEDSDSDSHQHE